MAHLRKYFIDSLPGFKKRIALVLALVVATTYGYATWSIIVIDPRTHQIGIAGASCTSSVYGIGAIIPGRGAVIVQAMSSGSARAKGIRMIMANATPAQIVEAMRDPSFDPENQQYAVVTVSDIDSPATYTGTNTHPQHGSLTAKGVSVQGNILVTNDELQACLDAVLQAQKRNLPIEEVLMQALEAGGQIGGDSRCGERKAESAFLSVADPTDHPDKLFLNLIVSEENTKNNPVKTLRRKLEEWKRMNKQ